MKLNCVNIVSTKAEEMRGFYALALNTNSKILFYNTAMLEAANVAVPTTMDEWVAAVRALSSFDH